MAFQFVKATKEQAKLRLALFGPSGAGKTYSALRIASGMSGKLAVIDTERGSASKYADRFEFDVLELEDKTIEVYCQAIDAAAKAGYGVLIVDSLSHAWQELLEEIDKLAKNKYRGNTWSAWSDGTPKQRQLVDAILAYPGHIIATMRSKTEWTTQTNSSGKAQPVRVGLAPEQGKGIEYEFDLLMELSVDHAATVLKDRTGKFQDQIIDKPGEDFGEKLAAWLSSGEAPAPREEVKAPHWIDDEDTRKKFWAWATSKTLSKNDVHKALGVGSVKDYAGDKAAAVAAIDAWVAAQATGAA
jgi:hypothetical protein